MNRNMRNMKIYFNYYSLLLLLEVLFQAERARIFTDPFFGSAINPAYFFDDLYSVRWRDLK